MALQKIHPLTRIGDLEIRLIRVFKAVVDSGGFTAAVPTLGISRSAVSLYMTDLEARIGLKLCQRGRSGFSLTEEGREVYDAAMQLLAATETFRTEVNSLHSALRGELNIGITDNLISLPQMKITHALARLKAQGPEVHINIYMCPSGEVESGVIDGRFHVGVVPVVNAMSALDYRHLYTEDTYLYCGALHSLAASGEAADAAAIAAADAVQPAYSLSAEGQSSHAGLNGTATASDREGIAFLLLTGCYIGFLPEHFARRWVAAGQLFRLCSADYAYCVDYAAITRRGRRPHRILETFLTDLEIESPGS